MEHQECSTCGKEMKEDKEACLPPDQQHSTSRKKVYAILVMLLVILGGAALLMFAGILHSPLQNLTTIAIVNGEKISASEVNRELEAYKKNYGQGGRIDFSSPAGEKKLEAIRKRIIDSLIYERIFVTEAIKEGLTVSPEVVSSRVAAAKKSLNLSDAGFEEYLKKNGTNLADFTKQIERTALMKQLIVKGIQEKGLTQEAWVKMIKDRAKVERLAE